MTSPDSPDDNPIASLQRRRNACTRDEWRRYAAHREQVTRLLVASAPAQSGRLAILGAGNCNDFDLPRIAAVYDEVQLIDLDSAAVAAGVARQMPGGFSSVLVRESIEITGCAKLSPRWKADPPPLPDLLAAVSQAASPILNQIGDDFDVVASVCLWSQIVDSWAQLWGVDHPRLAPLISALRQEHFQLISRLLRPGGQGWFISDLVSSDTLPELATSGLLNLPTVLSQALLAGNFFLGVHPGVIAQELKGEQHPLIQGIEMQPPWIWEMGPRTYAVFALGFSRSKLR